MPKGKARLSTILEEDVSQEEALQRAKYPVTSFLWRMKHGADIKAKIPTKRIAPAHDLSVIIKHADRILWPDAQYADDRYFTEVLPAVRR